VCSEDLVVTGMNWLPASACASPSPLYSYCNVSASSWHHSTAMSRWVLGRSAHSARSTQSFKVSVGAALVPCLNSNQCCRTAHIV
jgi:hypothetical protein